MIGLVVSIFFYLMTQSLTDLLGTNATSTSTTITITLADLKDANGNAYLADPSTATDDQKVAALLAAIHVNCKPTLDTNGFAVEDKTMAIVAEESFSPKTFETREDVSQIKNEFVFSIYTSDNTTFDPDNVV